MNFNFTDPKGGNAPSHKRFDTLAKWEKHHADGKWFWIFKRSAAWLTAVIFLFGTANFLFPDQINFQGTHIFIALFMFGGYFLGSLNEWAKMEEMFQTRSFSGE